jgi:hypothetical protein
MWVFLGFVGWIFLGGFLIANPDFASVFIPELRTQFLKGHVFYALWDLQQIYHLVGLSIQ